MEHDKHTPPGGKTDPPGGVVYGSRIGRSHCSRKGGREQQKKSERQDRAVAAEVQWDMPNQTEKQRSRVVRSEQSEQMVGKTVPTTQSSAASCLIANWPQAASMSTPELERTITCAPASRRAAINRSKRSGDAGWSSAAIPLGFVKSIG